MSNVMAVFKDISALIEPVATIPTIISIAILILGYYLYQVAFATDIPHIDGIPELPGAIPLYGHLKVLGDDHPTVFEEAYKRHGWDVVQAKLGNRRILVLNSFEAAQDFMVKNQGNTIDRPLFWTFHNVVSTSQGGTVGTSPWNESTKRMRTAAGALATRPAIQRSAPMIDLETTALVKDMYREAAKHPKFEVDPRLFFQREALNLTLMWAYGTRIADIDDPLLSKILYVAHSVSTFRSTNNNIQDYVPIYRYLGQSERTKLAFRNKAVRDVWLNELFQRVVDGVASGKEIDESEIRSLNVSFVSGGFETLATSGTMGIAYFSTPDGQRMQETAYNDIIASYGSAEAAWRDCVLEEKSAYVQAYVREGLRFWAPIPFGTPRSTYRAFEWRGIQIPKGVTVYPSAQAINHDTRCYGPDADVFRPERWLDGNGGMVPGPPYHYSFGAGSRMCTAVGISNRLLYATYVRLLVHFKIATAPDAVPNVDPVDFNENRADQSAIPKRFSVRLQLRDELGRLKRDLDASEKATFGLYC